MKKRLKPKDRKNQLVQAALEVAEQYGYNTMRREDIAHHAQVSEGLVSQYLGTMPQLRRTIIRHSIKTRNLSVLAQGIVNRDPHALKAPEDLRQAAVASMMGN